MSLSLQKRLQLLVESKLQNPGDWLVWCDPQRLWLPLLQRVARNRTLGGFRLVDEIKEEISGHFGSPRARQQLQGHIDAGEPFVLYVPVAQNELGWLWAQALLATERYDRSLHAQLVEWGWRPPSLTISDAEVALQAQQNLTRDPAAWGAGGIQPDPALLLDLLAGFIVFDKTASHPVYLRQEAKGSPDGAASLHEISLFQLELTVAECGLPLLNKTELEMWRKQAVARLLVTQAHQIAPAVVPETHPLLIAAQQRTFALRLLADWVDSHRLSQVLPQAILEADRIAALATGVATLTLAVQPFLSQAAERALFVAVCTRLAQQQGKALLETLAGMVAALHPHCQGFWGERMARAKNSHAVPWAELQRLSMAARDLVDATPPAAWPTPQAAIDWYVGGGWRMDQAGEEINRNLEVSPPELVALIAPLRAAYRARWEQTLIDWSELWSQAGCPLPTALTSAGVWLKQKLATSSASTAILMLDALRYDLGAKLAARLNAKEGAERAVLTPARAPLPSITPLGMAMALPLEETELTATLVDKKWQVGQRGHTANLSLAENRRAWWQTYGSVPAAGLLDIQAIKNGVIPPPGKNCLRLLIHDAAIDTLGHDDELEFQGSNRLLERYLDAIEQLRDQGWRRILIVTDHGFIHWTSSEERDAPKPAPDPAYSSRRAVAYPTTQPLTSPQGLAPGGQWRVALPRGAASFRAYGGFGYFHGGASLQEWIIPCMVVEWPVEAARVDISLEPLKRIMSLRPKVVLHIAAQSLIREFMIPRQVEVVVRAAETLKLLFRSDPLVVSADQSPKEVNLSRVEGATADRGTPVRIEIRDPRSEEILGHQDSMLMVELTAW